MSLNRRLTLALLIVVLGPVLVSLSAVAFFAHDRVEDLEHRELRRAEEAVRTVISSLCERARTAAEVIAVAHPTRSVVQHMVTTETVHAARVLGVHNTVLSSDIHDTATDSHGVLQTAWGECRAAHAPQAIVASAVPLVSHSGENVGRAEAAFLVNPALIEELERASGAHVAVMTDVASKVGGVDTSTQRVREIHPGDGQPLHLFLGVQHHDTPTLYVVLGIVVVIVAIAAVFAAAWFTRTLTKPLSELVHAAERASVGNLSTRVPVRGHDETTRLARAFNRMMHDLEKYVSVLRASRGQMRGQLTQLGTALAAGSDAASVLQLALAAACTATGAQRGIVLCAQHRDGGTVLVGVCARGFGAQFRPSDVHIPYGSGVLGRVAQRGVGKHGHVVIEKRGTVGHSPLIPVEEGCTYIAAPFRCGDHGRVNSVLVLYDRLGGAGDEFHDTDLSALQGFLSLATSKIQGHGVRQSPKNSNSRSGLGYPLHSSDEGSA